jgi:SAM-dependent methyltransferase
MTQPTSPAKASSPAQAASPIEASSPAKAASPVAAAASPAKAGSPAPAPPPAAGATSPPELEGELQPASHWNEDTLARGPILDDNDSAFHQDEDSTASISSSILEYRSVNGRTYHSDKFDSKYWGPNDTAQSESMDVQHHVFTMLLDGKLFLAPLKDDIEKAVDIGTGTGLWPIDFGDQFPNCHVIGTDISLNQQTWTPPNVEFQIDNLTLDWTFKDCSMDYVHLRWLIGSVTDWTALMRQAYRVLKPGGWVEWFEMDGVLLSDDGTVGPKSAMGQWHHIFSNGARKLGSDASFRVVMDGDQRRSMEEAGFCNIQERCVKAPIGTWPADPKLKELGRMQQFVIESDVEGYITLPANALGWTKEHITVFAALLRREVRSSKIHGYALTNVCFAQKPE